MNYTIADHSLNLNDQALAFLQILSHVDMPQAERVHNQTFAFYNGRERWVGVEITVLGPRLKKKMPESLIIIWGEQRNSDSFCVQHWRQEPALNPPTIKDMPEESYSKNRRTFDPYTYGDAVSHVCDLIHEYLRDNPAANKEG